MASCSRSGADKYLKEKNVWGDFEQAITFEFWIASPAHTSVLWWTALYACASSVCQFRRLLRNNLPQAHLHLHLRPQLLTCRWIYLVKDRISSSNYPFFSVISDLIISLDVPVPPGSIESVRWNGSIGGGILYIGAAVLANPVDGK